MYCLPNIRHQNLFESAAIYCKRVNMKDMYTWEKRYHKHASMDPETPLL